jgi:dihydrodipicolinate synthase/N-acetylneuraminate lyase
VIPSVADRLFGAFPVIPTPFNDDQSLDMDGLGEIIDRMLAYDVRALMLLGSQSEVTYLTDDEQCRVVEFAKQRAGTRALILAGLVQSGTAAAVEHGKRIRDLGADALVVALPQQYETPFPMVVTHFSAVVRDVGLPTLYYHYPEPTHLRLTPERIGVLFGEAALVGIQNGALDTDDVLAQIREVGRPIAVFSGSSFDCLACLDGGAAGSICPEIVLMPKTALRLVSAHRSALTPEAEALQNHLLEASPIVSPRAADGPVFVPHAGVKEALVAAKVIRSATVRAPQPGVPEARLARIRELAARLVEL